MIGAEVTPATTVTGDDVNASLLAVPADWDNAPKLVLLSVTPVSSAPPPVRKIMPEFGSATPFVERTCNPLMVI